MSLKKRGLGRGLEALLSDVLVKVERDEDGAQDRLRGTQAHQVPADSLAQIADVGMKLQDARRDLLEEAQALKTLIEDLEQNLRAD